MKVEFHKNFVKTYKKRFGNDIEFRKKFEERTHWFTANPDHPLLHNHPLKDKKQGYYSFSITGDIRVVYTLQDTIAFFVDIGTHNQVY